MNTATKEPGRDRLTISHRLLIQSLGLAEDTVVVSVTPDSVGDTFILDVKGSAYPVLPEGAHCRPEGVGPGRTMTASLAAQTVALRASPAAFSDSSVEVDEKAGVIRNVAIMTEGEARGWGFFIDHETNTQVLALITAAGDAGVRMRFRHPEYEDDGTIPEDLGTVIGDVKNARIVGASLRGDVHLGDYAECLPGLGDVKTYLLRLAKSNPARFGLSAVIAFDAEPMKDKAGDVVGIVARVTMLDAIDVVGRGAATPNGLLAEKPPAAFTIETSVGNRAVVLTAPTKDDVLALRDAVHKKTPTATAPGATAAALQKGAPLMDPKTKEFLITNYGLAPDATDEEAQSLLDTLTEEQKAEMTAKLAEVPPLARPDDAAKLAARRTQVITDDGDRLLAQEGRRVTQLQQLGKTLTVPDDVVSLSVAAGDTVIDARKKFLAHLTEKAKPVAGVVRVGDDRKITALSAAMPDALVIRSGYHNFYQTDARNRVVRDSNGVPKRRDAHELSVKFADLSALDMYRHWLIAMGAPSDEVVMLSRTKLAQLLGKRELRKHYPQVAQLAQSSSDFDNLLLDAQNKTLRSGYVEAARTWNLWAKRGTAPDFKNINRVQWSEIPNLTARNEGAPINYVTISDSKETYALAKYDAGVRLTWQALINDDMNVFGEIPFKLGQAAARKEDDVAYGVITANANMSDTGALFNGTAATTAGGHANLASATAVVGAPTTVATVSATEKLILLQKGPKNAAFLDLTPKFCLVPVALKTATQQFFASRVDPSKSNEVPNPYNGIITVVANARLDANSTAAWYLAADYRDGIDTVEVCFLQDEPEPVLKQESDFDTDDAKYAVRHTVAAKALEFRGLAKNNGA